MDPKSLLDLFQSLAHEKCLWCWHKLTTSKCLREVALIDIAYNRVGGSRIRAEQDKFELGTRVNTTTRLRASESNEFINRRALMLR